MADSNTSFLDDFNSVMGNPGAAPQPTAAPATQVTDPFTVGPEIKADAQRTLDDAKASRGLLTGFITAAQAADAQKEQQISGLVTAKQQVLDSATTDTANMTKAVVPLFQRRQAIADREAEVAGMNPLKRAVLGIFSLSHNPEWLAQQDEATKGQILAHSSSYSALMGLRDDQVKQLEAQAENQSRLTDLHVQNMGLDVQRSQQLTASSDQIFGAAVKGLDANSAVLRAQGQARADLMSGMTEGQVNGALSQAQANGGNATINGVTLRAGELKDLSMNWKEKNLALQGHGLAIQSAQLQLANAFEEKYMNHASVPELENMMKTGKMPNGSAVNQAALTQALATAQARNTLIAGSVERDSAAPMMLATVHAIASEVTAGNTKSASLFGSVPIAMETKANQIATRIQVLAQQQEAANAKGVGPDFAAKTLPEIQALREDYRKTIKDQATLWGGGDKDLTALAYGTLTNDPINPQDSAQALIKLTRTGTQPGTNMSPQAKRLMDGVKTIVDAYDKGGAGAQTAGQTPEQMWTALGSKKKTPDGKAPDDLTKQVQSYIQRAYQNTTMTEALQSAPALARSVTGPDGQPHPFNRINPQDFTSSLARGDQQGYDAIGSMIGMSGIKAKEMFANPTAAQRAAKYQVAGVGGVKEEVSFDGLSNRLFSMQTTATLKSLDASPSAVPGFRPSDAFVNLMNDPNYQHKVSSSLYDRGTQSSVGDYAVHSIAGNQGPAALQTYGQLLQGAQAANTDAEYKRRVGVAAKLRNYDPTTSMLVTLHAIPGIDTNSANMLMANIAQEYRTQQPNGTAGVIEGAIGGAKPFADFADQMILQGKFANPQLERIRQLAAKDWAKTRPMVDKGLNGMIDSFTSSPLNPFSSAGVFGAAARAVTGDDHAAADLTR